MKNINLKWLVFFGSILAIGVQASAQDSVAVPKGEFHKGEFGIRYNPTFTILGMRTYNGQNASSIPNVSEGIGIKGAFNFCNHFGIQGEVSYYQVSQSFTDRNLSNEVKINYVDVPLLFCLSTDKSNEVSFNITAGPQISFTSGTSFKSTGVEISDTLNGVARVKQTDIGIAFGIGAAFSLNKEHTLQMDWGYHGFYGLVDENEGSNPKGTYNVILNSSRKTYGAYLGLTYLF